MALACAVLVPFLTKAFTVDDTLFLRQAEHALHAFLHPAAFDIVWFDVPVRLSAIMPSGPVMAWLLIPTAALGGSEVVGHLTSLLLYLVAIAATSSLALRLGFRRTEARLAGLFMVAMPASLGMAATVMPDLAAMTLGVLGLDQLVHWSSSRRWLSGAIAAVALGLAPLARSHLLGILGVGVLLLVQGSPFACRSWLSGPPARWLPLAGASVVLAILSWVGHEPGEAGVVGAMHAMASAGRVDQNILAFFSHWTWSMPFALGWCLLRWRQIVVGRVVWMVVPTALLLLGNAGRHGAVMLGVAVAIGLAAVTDALVDGFEARDARRFGLACWLLLALPLVFYIHLPPKYHVASAPAAAMLLAHAARRAGRWWGRAVLIPVSSAGLILGVLIVRADDTLAGFERDVAQTEISPRVAAGERVWFSGHWGFQWYAERAGARPLVRNSQAATRGDIILVDDQAFNQGLIDDYPGRRLLGFRALASPGGRIMNREANAGFYSNEWGDLPWTWSRNTEANRISFWIVE